MSDKPRDITLERIHRLTQAVADLTDSHAAQGRQFLALFGRIEAQLEAMKSELVSVRSELSSVNRSVRELASEQVLLGNRVENAFSRALRVNIRLDELESIEAAPQA